MWTRYWLASALVAAAAGPVDAAALNGRVVEDHSGSPVASAVVRLLRVGERNLTAEMDTDREGRFQVDGLEAGEYRIDISKSNYAGATLRVRLGGGDPLSIRLIRLGSIEGRVADIRGQPAARVNIFAMPRKAGPAPLRPIHQLGYSVVTDRDGRYRLHNLAPGQYAVAAAYGSTTVAVGGTGSPFTPPSLGTGAVFYPDNARIELLTVSGGEEHRDIDLTLLPGASARVSGKAEQASKEARFWLALAPVERPELAVAVTQTDADGAFRFEGVEAGAYHLFASGPVRARGSRGAVPGENARFVRMRLDMAGDRVDGLSLVPEEARTVRFLLRDGGLKDCAASGQILLEALEDWAAYLDRRETAPLDEPVEIGRLAPARYTVSVTGLGDACYVLPVEIDLSAGVEVVEIPVVAAGAIRGWLLTGEKLPSQFAVVLLDAAAGQEVQVAYPDADARFEFAGLRPGRYRIAARPARETEASRWLPDVARMVEIDVPGGSPTDVELPTP